jgi:hypothetical protein
MRVGLDLIVKEYPSSREFIERNIMSISTIFSVRVDIYTHLRLIDPNGEDQCSYSFKHPEFRNGLIGEGRIGYIALHKDVTPITVMASARNGVWYGYILLRRRTDGVDYDQVLHGTVISALDGSKHKMTVKEARLAGRVLHDPELPDRLTREMLVTYGVPVVGTDRPKYTCPSLSY